MTAKQMVDQQKDALKVALLASKISLKLAELGKLTGQLDVIQSRMERRGRYVKSWVLSPCQPPRSRIGERHSDPVCCLPQPAHNMPGGRLATGIRDALVAAGEDVGLASNAHPVALVVALWVR